MRNLIVKQEPDHFTNWAQKHDVVPVNGIEFIFLVLGQTYILMAIYFQNTPQNCLHARHRHTAPHPFQDNANNYSISKKHNKFAFLKCFERWKQRCGVEKFFYDSTTLVRNGISLYEGLKLNAYALKFFVSTN